MWFYMWKQYSFLCELTLGDVFHFSLNCGCKFRFIYLGLNWVAVLFHGIKSSNSFTFLWLLLICCSNKNIHALCYLWIFLAFVANLDLKIVFLRSQTVTVSFYLQRRGKRVVSNLENNEGESRTASEMADVLYHSMALLAKKGVKIEDVLQVLRLRFSQSGIEEKKSRVFQKSMDWMFSKVYISTSIFSFWRHSQMHHSRSYRCDYAD